MDRGYQDGYAKRKVRAKQDVDFRKHRLRSTAFMILIPAILFIIYWSNVKSMRDWRNNIFVIGSGLIIIGSLFVLIFETLTNDMRLCSCISSIILFGGGIIYLIAAIGEAMLYSNGHTNNLSKDVTYDRLQDSTIDVKDGIYWFGLHCLIALDAIVLAWDCLTDLCYLEYMRISNWAFPLMVSTWFAFAYWLNVPRDTWWEKCAIAGFGAVAISTTILMIISCSRSLVRTTGAFLSFMGFLASILIWIYFAYIIKQFVNNGHDACLLIGIPFLISAQMLSLLHNCSLGSQDCKHGERGNRQMNEV